MALPHLKSNFYSQKISYENSISKKRNFDEDYRQKWNDKVKYFQQSNVQSNKMNQWSSEKSFNNSINAYNKQLSNTNHIDKNLPARKVKLTELFEFERLQYQKELETRLLNDDSSFSILKNRAQILKSAREEERRKDAEQKFIQHFRLNNPDLRKVEQEIINKEVTDFWPKQIHEKSEEETKERDEIRKYEELENMKQKMAKEKERNDFQEKVLQERYIKDSLRRQIDEIKRKEEESKSLKLKEAELLQTELEIDEFYRRRQLINDLKAKKDYGRALLRQHTAVMRRKSQQIQEELESDIQFLNYLSYKDEEENEVQTARKQMAKQDIEWMKEVMEDQLRKERERESELDSIFAEEAAKLWSKREKEWDKEKLAREKLMDEVLNERKLQMQQKINNTREQQSEALRDRERLLEEIETARYENQKENKAIMQKKTEFRTTLDNQLYNKRRQQLEEHDQRKNELEEEIDAEKAYEQLLNEEAERMRSLGITPRSARR